MGAGRTTSAAAGGGNPYRHGFAAGAVATSPGQRLRTMGEMGALAVRVLRLAVTPPFPWLREAVTDVAQAYRRCIVPLALSHSVYLIGFGIILFGGILDDLGVSDREGGTVFIIWSREIATWITGMLFAGVVGSAVTADLGARKIREELDAMAVLGVDRLRALIVPRVVGMTLAMPVLAFISLLMVNVVNWAIAPGYFGFSDGVFLDSLANIIQPSDLWLTMLLKNALIGLFVGVVACYKGLASKPGAEGVGRAVNETVVITFFGIWLFDVVFNLAYFTVFPDVSALRG
ncbi:ABC transporter permease [Conexibacter sp. SYSU D00693]|uniref:MlaE family ABC transporter permease n=1 Tax=Conexibacter sp. SYSU D00693 TaxID=2812560 RepID=UPI00196A3573|nr:ABC transporter permease [Conexibacter sp. SYSU D00693]